MAIMHPVHNPYSGEIVNSVRLIDTMEMEEAINRSAAAFQQARRVPAYRRAELLKALAEGVRQDRLNYADAIVREAGKPLSSSLIEVDRAAGVLEGSAGEATRIGGETVPLDTAPAGAGRVGFTRRFPIGPIAGISPFNFPLNLGIHKVGPALASGNTILWKPPLEAPGASLLFAELFQKVAREQEFPVDAVQVVCCENDVAEQLVTDARMKMLSFTGSAVVGWRLRAKAGGKKVTLELGGNAAVVIGDDLDDAALANAASRCAEGGYGYAGQVCIAVQRVIVHESVYERFRELLLERVRALRIGDPADMQTQVGPMVSAREANRVDAWIQEAVSQGAELLCGGARSGYGGLTIAPALFENVSSRMKIVSQEIFGPAVTLQRYAVWDEALALVNGSEYGLQAGIFTRDIGRVMQAFNEIEAGAVIVNDIPTLRIDSMPYGGVKNSGLGREGMRYAVEDMTEERLLVI